MEVRRAGVNAISRRSASEMVWKMVRSSWKIGALAEDAQVGVDFGESADAGSAGGAHLSYWMREKIS